MADTVMFSAGIFIVVCFAIMTILMVALLAITIKMIKEYFE